MIDLWSERFNALPDETRRIAAAVNRQSNIQFLELEKVRLTKQYRRSVKEIDDHIKNLEASIAALGGSEG
jgi:hypothetical protein